MNKIIEEDLQDILKNLAKESKELSGRTILITGASGFLGNYFIALFALLNRNLKKPIKVIALDNLITGSKKNIAGPIRDKNIKFIKHDVIKPFKYNDKIDYIIHAAGIASPVYYQKYPIQTIDVATLGTRNTLELARKKRVKSFVFFSSSEIYGDPSPDFIPTPETYRGHVSSIGPRSCYDESKRLGEALSMSYFNFYNVPVKIIRPFNVYGPGMKLNDYRVIPTFLGNALKNKELPIHGTGQQTRTYCYISDAIVGFMKVLLSKSSGEVYNIGNDDNEIDLMGLANVVSETFGHRVKLAKIPYPASYPADEPTRRCPDLTRARTKLNYNPKIDLKTGIRRLTTWYRQEFFNK